MDIERAIAIGHEIVGINAAIDEGKIGYGNRHFGAGRSSFDFYQTDLFSLLSQRRENLRMELLDLENESSARRR